MSTGDGFARARPEMQRTHMHMDMRMHMHRYRLVTDSPEHDPRCPADEASYIRQTVQQYMHQHMQHRRVHAHAPPATRVNIHKSSGAINTAMNATVNATVNEEAMSSTGANGMGMNAMCASVDATVSGTSSTGVAAAGAGAGAGVVAAQVGAKAPLATPTALALYSHIFRSSACWAIAIAHTAYDVGLYICDDGLPPYLRDVLDVRFSTIGFMLAVPGFLKPVVIVVSAGIADRLRSRMRTAHVRKLVTAIAFLPQILFLFLLGTGALIEPYSIGLLMAFMLPLGLAANGGGYAVNHLDIAPTVASLVLAFYNTGGQVAGWAAPYLMAELTAYPDGISREQHLALYNNTPPSAEWVAQMERQWRTVYLGGALLQAAGGVAYFVMGDDAVQPWVPLQSPKDSRQAARRGEARRPP
mmetsp:Transcript_11444/g.23065  ORF Transcript_11444/g.23065 Transcript_11444/m.23065 type:complete len:414 (-) Transcript_11444:586-1827(-)